jgi:hypothetical protein
MASKVSKKTKKAAAKTQKKAARAASKKAAGKASPRKKAGTGRKTAKAPSKARSGKPASARSSARAPSSGQTTLEEASADLDVADLDEVEDLLEAKAPKARASARKPTKKAAKKTGPSTPTVPRAVKPVPRVADAELGPELLEFIDAVDKYRQKYSRPFPTWREVFYIFIQLGYERPAG